MDAKSEFVNIIPTGTFNVFRVTKIGANCQVRFNDVNRIVWAEFEPAQELFVNFSDSNLENTISSAELVEYLRQIRETIEKSLTKGETS